VAGSGAGDGGVNGLSASWMKRYEEADSLYTTRECGCLVFVVIDLPREVRAARDTIVRESLAGRSVKRCKRADLPPLYCPVHSAARA
jgi:hypothetical protein